MKKQKIKLKCLKFATKIGIIDRGSEIIFVDELAKNLYDWVTGKQESEQEKKNFEMYKNIQFEDFENKKS